MSDILIKGMKMPPKGEYTATIYVDSDGTAYIDFDSREMDEYTVYDGKCDLVEVPPHGRLIDTDSTVEVELYDDEHEEWKTKFMSVETYLGYCGNEVPTIIESEEMNG